MLIVWKEEFAVDHGVIDEDHKFLIENLNGILKRLNARAPAGIVHEMAGYVRSFAALHFLREERLQEQAEYPGLEEHRDEHRRMLTEFDRFIAQFAALREDAPVEDIVEAKKFIYRWILGHILCDDGKLAPYLAKLDTSGELPLVRTVA